MRFLFLCLQFPRSDAKSHSRTRIESHLNLALRCLEATQDRVYELSTVVKDQSQQIQGMISKYKEKSYQIERQSEQIERQSEQIERLMSKDKEQSKKMERLMSRVQDQAQQIKRLTSRDKEQSEKMERLISTVQGQPPQRERREPINQIFLTPFEWELPNIEEAISSSQTLASRPFYLRDYKYLLQIKPLRMG